MSLIDVDASKLSLLGSEIDPYLNYPPEYIETAWDFDESISNSTGISCWTVKDSKLVRWTEALFSGDFRQEGAYLLLQTVALSHNEPSVFTHTIYTWFGIDSSTKDAELISFNAIELSEYLGTHPHLQRQMQSHESSSFLALFYPYFLVSLDGLDSAHISPASILAISSTTPRLWQISLPLSEKGGRKQLKVQEVVAVTGSLTRNNVYILDRGDNLEIWYGKASHPFEKEKAHEIGEFWVESRGGKTTLTSFDDGSREDDTFFIDLGISSANLPIHFPPYSPAQTPAISSSQAYSLLNFDPSSDSSTSSSFPIKFNQKLLIPQATYLIITIARSAYYIWVGSEVSKEDGRRSMSIAQKIAGGLVERGRASAGRVIIKVTQNYEGEEFWNAIGGR